jgi:hypothetical protein
MARHPRVSPVLSLTPAWDDQQQLGQPLSGLRPLVNAVVKLHCGAGEEIRHFMRPPAHFCLHEYAESRLLSVGPSALLLSDKAATRSAPPTGPNLVRGSHTGPGGAGCLLARPEPDPEQAAPTAARPQIGGVNDRPRVATALEGSRSSRTSPAPHLLPELSGTVCLGDQRLLPTRLGSADPRRRALAGVARLAGEQALVGADVASALDHRSRSG